MQEPENQGNPIPNGPQPARELIKLEQEQQHYQQVLSSNILRQIWFIQILTCATFLFATLYLQAMCMVRNICGMSGIECSLTFQRSLIAFYLFTLLIIYMVYSSVVDVKPRFVFFVKWPLLAYSIVLIVFAVVAFIFSSNYSIQDVQERWDMMTTLSKQWYQNDIQNLLDDNVENLLLVGTYHIITGVLLIIIFFFLFNYQYIMPGVWRPPLTIRTSFEKIIQGLIYQDGGKVVIRKKKQEIGLGEGQEELGGQSNIEKENEEDKEKGRNIPQPSRFQKLSIYIQCLHKKRRLPLPPSRQEEEKQPLQSNINDLSPEKQQEGQEGQEGQVNRPW